MGLGGQQIGSRKRLEEEKYEDPRKEQEKSAKEVNPKTEY